MPPATAPLPASTAPPPGPIRGALLAVVRWLLGDIPEREREPGAGPLAVLVCSAAATGMWLGTRHALKGDPLPVGAWRMLVHGGVPLIAVAGWELRKRWAAGVRAVDFGLVVAGVALLLGPIVVRFAPHGATWIADAPLPHIVIPALLGAGLVLAGLARAGAVLAEWGIGLGDWRWWLPHHGVLLAALVPVLVLTTWMVPALANYYPVYAPARTHLDALLLAHAAIGLDFIGWEFLFRGFLLFGIARRGDTLTAILLQALPFFLLHSPKPELEMISSYVGGIFAGWFCLRARSFLPLYVIHFVMITTVGCASFALRALG